MFLALVDALDDSPNPTDQERGRIMLEERLGIEQTSEGPKLRQGKATVPLHDALGILFNLYARAERHGWILSLTGSLPENLQSDTLMMRNRARALAKRNENEQAAAVYEEALKVDPTDDQTLAWYADFLDDQGRYADAYEMFEKAIVADPEDGNLLVSLGIHVLNRGHFRGKSGTIEGPLPRKTRSRAAVPLMMRALEIENYRTNLVQKVVRVLVRGDAMRDAEAIAAGQTPEGKYDTAPLDHLTRAIEFSSDTAVEPV